MADPRARGVGDHGLGEAGLRYEVVDVFAPRPFAGNPLAVVLDAGHLTAAQCQSIASEFHLSETTFVSDVTATGYRVRIFTASVELPFAGHPSVGTAHTLVRLGLLPAGTLQQQCGVGVVPVEVGPDGARLTGGPVSLRPAPDAADLAAAVGLTAADLTGRPAHLVGCGIDFAQLEVRPEALARAVPDRTALARLLPDVEGGISLLVWDAATRTGTVRVFAGGMAWEEDPATGSAALGTGVWLAAVGLVPDGTTDFVLHQGEQIARPSVLRCTVTSSGGRAERATVAGDVLPVARGVIRVPAPDGA
ncbi:PhzF family phenazine biosynthesis isomerase [Modestobacter sp. I12A-02628]|uniref:PhzF family phenazine biosynthesis protein n=1 Tax=Goekera deserti TaxID=2497753 RepID=A0A7K3WEX4_9ACTN|nr:PhzF family phenazine biosynthesis protein [Goekera deserti]MPQ98485.1 PhzF family phenazine biosynthesis isomerase [Goekera deserti]NDI48314.1 PhzF family phenazine biosynthesis isomerase [Goekera deserti]NEL54063.1 PhzF family phenazine biosynthesis protein [Goekera deserti]